MYHLNGYKKGFKKEITLRMNEQRLHLAKLGKKEVKHDVLKLRISQTCG